MYKFSKHSQNIIESCDPRIQRVFEKVIQIVDCRALSGRRGEEEQNELFYSGKSQLKYPESYHNKTPYSKAIDIVPYPIDWNDRERFTLFAGLVLGIAEEMGIKLTWGGDWDRDFLVGDNNFDDLGHFQVEEELDG